METIGLLFNEANVLPTLAMLAVAAYWILMVIGVVGMDTIDVDVDLDAGVDLDLDPGIDVDVDAPADIDTSGNVLDAGGADLDSGGGSATAGNSPLRPLFEFLYMSDVPIVIVATAFMFGYWISNITLNLLFNPANSFVISLLWIIPNFIAALLIARIIVMPAAAIGRKTGPEDTSRSKMLGMVGVVTTDKVTDRFGQMEVTFPNEPEIKINIHVAPGQKLSKGDAAKIISYNNEDGTFLVELTKWENNHDD
jgi:hypothetical protein